MCLKFFHSEQECEVGSLLKIALYPRFKRFPRVTYIKYFFYIKLIYLSNKSYKTLQKLIMFFAPFSNVQKRVKMVIDSLFKGEL